jgi:hypothetical protein
MPPPRNSVTARLEALAAKLESLRASDPEGAIDLAIEIVARERAHRVLEPALEILAEAAPSRARSALRDRFLDLTENGVRFDQDCALRIGIVRALRPIGSPDDRDLAITGVRTIQLQPPSRIDVAQALRGQSLLLLREADPERVDYYAVELLGDPHLSTFSGEPAVTAIQVLAARGQILPIWALARRPGLPPDVLAQAFASLRQAPADLQVDALLGHLAHAATLDEAGEPTALVAAEAIVLNRLPGAYPAVAKLLRETSNRNLFLYLVMAMVRNGDDALRAMLHELQRNERDRDKMAILADALGARPTR